MVHSNYFAAIASLSENSQTSTLDQLTKNQFNNWPTDRVIRLTHKVLNDTSLYIHHSIAYQLQKASIIGPLQVKTMLKYHT